jgi:putative sterol carrier protein
MPVFPTLEWVQAWVCLADASTGYHKVARGWDGIVCLAVFEERGGTSHEATYIRLMGRDGWWSEATVGSACGPVEEVLIYLEAPYSVWQEVIRQQLPPLKAILQGRIVVRGHLPVILRWRHAITALTALAGQVDTQFTVANPPDPPDGRR